jgi:hypothetical protein
MASVLGFVRRCPPARIAAALASSLYFLLVLHIKQYVFTSPEEAAEAGV